MNTNIKIVLGIIVALLIGGVGGYVLKDQTGNEWGPEMMSQNQAVEAIPVGMHRMPDGSMMGNGGSMGDMNGMGAMMEMTVSSEREFIEGMIPHHQEAIDTAKEVLERGGTTQEIRTLAENIITAQEREITEMKQWYEDWYGESYVANNEYMPMMRDLSQLSGVELDRTFLEDMVMHHMGAIMMAESVQPYIDHPELEQLTEDIATTQSSEIQLMRQLLRGL